jgi:hypothetical protein
MDIICSRSELRFIALLSLLIRVSGILVSVVSFISLLYPTKSIQRTKKRGAMVFGLSNWRYHCLNP